VPDGTSVVITPYLAGEVVGSIPVPVLQNIGTEEQKHFQKLFLPNQKILSRIIVNISKLINYSTDMC
jgi:hypothetical protein